MQGGLCPTKITAEGGCSPDILCAFILCVFAPLREIFFLQKVMLNVIKKAARTVFPVSRGNLGRRDYLTVCLYHLLRLALGALFVYAGLIKLQDPRAFAHAIAQFDLAPDPVLPVLAVGLPSLELLAGAGLIFRVRGSLTIIATLLSLFLLALGYAVLMEMDIDCGCFTAADLAAKTSVKTALVRDLFMAWAVAWLYWRRRRGPGFSSSLEIDNCERRKS
jgi:hypothetical protein